MAFEFFRRFGRGSTKPAARTVDLRARDCHTHIVPGVDDGSRSADESIAMLRLLHEAGARHVIATPHIFTGRFPNEPDDLRRAFGALQERMAEEDLPSDLSVELGAEHYLDESLVTRVEQGNYLSFGPERYVLFECATGEQTPLDLETVCHGLLERGCTPLMAHVERYRWARTEDGFEVLADLRALGVRFQVNRTVGKVNVVGQGPRGRMIEKLLDLGWIDEVGSDLHRPTPEGRPYAMDDLPAAQASAAS